MNCKPEWLEDGGAEMSRVEQTVFAAGNFIRPSEDLRPRTLEAAKEHCAKRRLRLTFSSMAIAIALLSLISIPLGARLRERRSQTVSPSIEIQHRAIEYATSAGFGPDWGLTEAFSQLRASQANHLGRSQTSSPR